MKFNLLSRYLKVIASYSLGYPLYTPDSLSIVVTNNCNLKCVMCDFWKDTTKASEGITLDEFRRLFADLKSFGVRMVHITGGEPFLRKDLIDILKSAKANGLKTAVLTNGTLIPEDNLLEFVRNIDLVYVSLDSPSGAQHEDIRGVPNIFEKITKNVKLLVKTIKDNAFPVRVILCTTITSKGMHDPAEMVGLAKDLGVNGIIYNPASSIYYGYTTFLKNADSNSIIPRDAYGKMIDKILALMGDPANMIRSNPFYLSASKEFLSGNDKYYKFPCFGGGYNGPLIAFNGTVFPCCAWNMPIGNVKEQSFQKIWRSSAARKARRKIKRGECSVCHHHTRTFDFIWRAPLLFKDPSVLLKGYKIISRM